MSKLGKKPITIPKDTKVKVEGGKIILTGPKGSRELSLNDKIFSATIADDKNLIIKLIKKNETSNILWGTTRSIINSALIGVSIGHEKILELIDISVMTGVKATPTASVKISMNGETHVAAETGVGPVDSAIKAIQKISDKIAHIRLKDFKIEAISGGTDALGEVVIKVEDNEGNIATARSSDGDIVIASTEAMIDGINKILTKKKISSPKEQLANP